jgi:hypothetical protein
MHVVLMTVACNRCVASCNSSTASYAELEVAWRQLHTRHASSIQHRTHDMGPTGTA